MTSNTEDQDELQRLWEGYRDGDLSEADRLRFQAHLKTHPDHARTFENESRWLALLEHPVPQAQSPFDRPFSARVLDRWDGVQEREGVLGRIRWRAAVFSGGWAAIAALVAIVMWLNQPQTVPTPPAREAPGWAGARMYGSHGHPPVIRQHPFTMLVRDVNEQFGRQPDEMLRVVQEASRWVDLNHLAEQLDVPPVQTVREGQE